MIIESSAPPRVDLEGGTIDIWPLYLFHPGATTVNFALSLRASCRIETNDDGRIVLESRDRKVSFETHLSALEDLLQEERLELVSKLVHFFKPTTGFHLVAEANVPAGAGLGGSSAAAADRGLRPAADRQEAAAAVLAVPRRRSPRAPH